MPKVLKWLPPIREPYTLFLIIKDHRTPLPAKLIALCIIALVLAYTIYPMDIIADYLPLLGWMDDLVLIPLGINLVEKFLPQDLLTENRAIAQKTVNKAFWVVFLVIVAFVGFWALMVTIIVLLITGF
jgi:uncharacterized membrane protein YkvA (DUF1232 family)